MSETTPRQQPPRTSTSQYTAKITKAGALIPDTKTLLAHWDVNAPVDQNLQRLQAENVFGKASRARVEDILKIFRQRYLSEPATTAALVNLYRRKVAASALDRLLYFHSAEADRLLFDSVVSILGPMQAAGVQHLSVPTFTRSIEKWIEEGKMGSRWSQSTTTHVVQGLLATLRDFGILEGAINKRIVTPFLPVEAFAYIVFYLKQHQPSGAKLIQSTHWALFFLTPDAVERFLFEAHQRHMLEYHVAGSVTRLTFPAKSLEEYANVLAER